MSFFEGGLVKILSGVLVAILVGSWAPQTHAADKMNTEAMKQMLRSMQGDGSAETRDQTDRLVDDLSTQADKLREADRCNQSCIDDMRMRLRPGETRRCREDLQCRSCLGSCNR